MQYFIEIDKNEWEKFFSLMEAIREKKKINSTHNKIKNINQSIFISNNGKSCKRLPLAYELQIYNI